jgi:hypothetical protein
MRIGNLGMLVTACSLGLMASSASATEYYSLALNSGTAVGTVVFEYDPSGGPLGPYSPYAGTSAPVANAACSGDWCSISAPGLFGYSYTTTAESATSDPYNFGHASSFNDYGIVPSPSKGFMLSVIDSNGQLATAPGVPDNGGDSGTVTDFDTTGMHLVISMNNGYAASFAYSAFSAAFPGESESDLINAVLIYNENVGAVSPFANDSNFNSYYYEALSKLDGFAAAYGDAIGYDLPITTFSILSYSDGVKIGTGTASDIAPAMSPAPEPSAWTMMLVGVAGLGCILRRRKIASGSRLA